MAKIKAAIEAAYQEGQAKLKGNGRSVPPLSAIKTPLRDGDVERPDDPAYANAYFINANSATAPGIVDADRNPVLTRSEVYSGVYGRASINAASLSGKLSQMANGAIYDDSGETIRIHDRKLDALEDIIEAANGKPLLVAYWFKHDLTRISERLRKLHIPFSKLDDAASIRRWNNGELPVALIHPASAGHGLNLQSGGSAIVWFGLTWSLELYQQTIARLWRQGQTSETVVVQHIVTKGTIDERIMKALSKKEHTQTALIDAVKADLKI